MGRNTNEEPKFMAKIFDSKPFSSKISLSPLSSSRVVNYESN
jgi:hypothetical protein